MARRDLSADIYQSDNSSAYQGMPVCIQVVGLTHQDEKVMGAMNIIDKVVNF